MYPRNGSFNSEPAMGKHSASVEESRGGGRPVRTATC